MRMGNKYYQQIAFAIAPTLGLFRHVRVADLYRAIANRDTEGV